MAEATGRRIKARPTADTSKKVDELSRALCLLCFYYPQYTLQQARKLPDNHVAMLLNTVRREKASDYLNLTHISAAPHTKKGTGVRKLLAEFKKVANG